MTEPAKTPDMQADERDAIAYLARRPEGRLLHRYLRREFEAGALQGNIGGCSLAHKLMQIMRSSIEETASDRNEYGPDQPVLSGGNAVNAGRRPTFREHAFATDPELGGTANRAQPT